MKGRILKWSIAATILVVLGLWVAVEFPSWQAKQPIPTPEAIGEVINGGTGYINKFFGLDFEISHGGRVFSEKGTSALIDKGVRDFELGKTILQNNLPSAVTAGIYPDTGQMVFIGCSKYAYPQLSEEQCLLDTIERLEKQKDMACTVIDTKLTAQIGGLDFFGFSYTLHSDTLDTRYQEEYLYMKDGSVMTIVVWGEGYGPDEKFLTGKERILGDFGELTQEVT